MHRFHSQTLADEVRGLLLKYPDRATDEPDALELLLGPSLPNDASSQLKVSSASETTNAESHD